MTLEFDDVLRNFLDGLPIAMGIANGAGELVFLNRRLQEVLGYSPGDLATLEEWWLTIYPDPDYRETVKSGWEAAVARATESGGRIDAGEYLITCKDGSQRLMEVGGTLLGEYQCALFQDVTEKRAWEDELRERVAFSDAIIDNAADGICVCHNTEAYPFVEFTVWSSRMQEITGYSLEEINTTGWYQTLYADPEVRERAIARMDRMRFGENLMAEEWTIQTKTGAQKTLAISTSLLLSAEGSAHVLGLMQDVTARKQAEESQRSLAERMQHAQKLESLGVLAGGIAHDFNNLLVAVLGHAELALADLPQASQAKRDVEAIKRAAQRAAELTNQMLAYSGKGRFIIEAVDLNALVDDMVQLLRASVPRSADMVLDLGELTFVRADASQLRQIVMNLVTNAAEALGPQGGVVTIHTQTRDVAFGELSEPQTGEPLPAGRYAVIEVADTGHGMDEGTLRRVFEPFFTTKIIGRGLGLAAVIGIVRAHKGSIRIHTQIDRGTRVEVFLPVDSEAETSATNETVPAPNTSSVILVVDDEASVRSVACRMLKLDGLRSLEASSGEAAVELFRAQAGNITAVLLDLTMPGMGGPAAAHAIWELDPDARILLMSGFTEQVLKEHELRERCTGFVQKPFTVKALRDALESTLEA